MLLTCNKILPINYVRDKIFYEVVMLNVYEIVEINFVLFRYHSYSADIPTSARRSATAPNTPTPLRLSQISPHSPASSNFAKSKIISYTTEF